MSVRKRANSDRLDWQVWEDDVFGVTENAVFPAHVSKEHYRPRTLVDNTLEIIDPTPNIYTLFVQFNTKYFRDVLLPVQVKWSNRMTRCAGVCTFSGRSGECIITLSAPLLKLRPRKDLVETLLHEMIHAYLFLTRNNRDRDGHGPEFCKHMQRINAEAGTNITIYHDFHDEVKLYQQHWWQCSGPCAKRPPYWGTVRRAMNRAPGPNDSWWAEHQRTCGGTFTKVRSPEHTQKKRTALDPMIKTNDKSRPPLKPLNNQTLDTWLTPPRNTHPKGSDQKRSNGRRNESRDGGQLLTSTPQSSASGPVKPGNSTNNVHGFGTGGPGSTCWSTNRSSGTGPSASGLVKLGNSTNKVHGFGTGGPGSTVDSPKTPIAWGSGHRLGSASSAKSGSLKNPRHLTFDPPLQSKRPKIAKSETIVIDDSPKPNNRKLPEPSVVRGDDAKLPECPSCGLPVPAATMNEHLDECLEPSPRQSTTVGEIICPICHTVVPLRLIDQHVDDCVIGGKPQKKPRCHSLSLDNSDLHETSTKPSSGASRVNHNSKKTDDPRSSQVSSTYKCLVCNAIISREIPLEQHLEECMKVTYGDDSADDSNDDLFVESTGMADFDSGSDDSVINEPNPNGESQEVDMKEFPCPVCMEVFPERGMNAHLDVCLGKA